jgi:hypothetical protein
MLTAIAIQSIGKPKMGGQVVLVIGDNFRDQLEKFRNTEFVQPSSPHLVAASNLEAAKEEYATVKRSFLRHVDGSLHNPWDPQFMRVVEGRKFPFVPPGYTSVLLLPKGNISFEKWVRRTFGFGILNVGENPDFLGEHAAGWVRVNGRGEIVEMMQRVIPEGFLDYFVSTDNSLLLKPGAKGIVIHQGEDDEAPATDGFAGSATKGAIDLDAMRVSMRAAATDRWNRAAAAAGSRQWEPFNTILKRVENLPLFIEPHSAALKQWATQPAVQAILDDCPSFSDPSTGIRVASANDAARWAKMSETERRAVGIVWNNHTHYAIDPLALPRGEYVQRFGLCDLLGSGEVINDFERMGPFDETELIDSLSDETVLTLAIVHC